MSNETSVDNKNVEDKEQVDGTSKKDESTLSEKQIEKDKHRESVFQGMIDAATLAVIKGDKSIEELDNSVKDEVQERLSKLNFSKDESQKTNNDEAIAQRVEERQELKAIVSKVEKDSKDDAESNYAALVAGGKTHAQACNSVRKLYDISTKAEDESFGLRSQKVGGSSENKKSLLKNANAREKKMLKAFGVE